MGGHPMTELGGRTVLEAARTPMIDSLCLKGELFLNGTVPEGYPPGSDVANLSLLGYDPRLYYTGRAPLEAASMGIELADDETAFRCNLVTLNMDGDTAYLQDFAAGHISSEEGAALLGSVNEALVRAEIEGFVFKAGISYRNLLIVKGDHPNFQTVPPHDYIEQDVTVQWNRYMADAGWKKMLSVVAEVFANHPVNIARKEAGKNPATMTWLWGEGKMPSAPPLTEQFHISGTMVSAVDLLKGLGVIGGLAVAEVEGATGYIDTNYEGKVAAALEALKTEDFAFVHLEGPDEAGHQGSLADKTQAIEDFDSRVVAPIIEELRSRGEDFRVLVTMDHFTPIELRTHTAEPVPTLIYDSREIKEGSGHLFSEKECRAYVGENNVPQETGYGVMARLLEREAV